MERVSSLLDERGFGVVIACFRSDGLADHGHSRSLAAIGLPHESYWRGSKERTTRDLVGAALSASPAAPEPLLRETDETVKSAALRNRKRNQESEENVVMMR